MKKLGGHSGFQRLQRSIACNQVFTGLEILPGKGEGALIGSPESRSGNTVVAIGWYCANCFWGGGRLAARSCFEGLKGVG